MAVVKGKVVGIGDYYQFKAGTVKIDYCPITVKCDNGDLVQISVNIKTMMKKTFMINSKTGDLIQVGMIKPKIGDWLEVEGALYESYDAVHTKTMKYVKKITRTVKPEIT